MRSPTESFSSTISSRIFSCAFSVIVTIGVSSSARSILPVWIAKFDKGPLHLPVQFLDRGFPFLLRHPHHHVAQHARLTAEPVVRLAQRLAIEQVLLVEIDF